MFRLSSSVLRVTNINYKTNFFLVTLASDIIYFSPIPPYLLKSTPKGSKVQLTLQTQSSTTDQKI